MAAKFDPDHVPPREYEDALEWYRARRREREAKIVSLSDRQKLALELLEAVRRDKEARRKPSPNEPDDNA